MRRSDGEAGLPFRLASMTRRQTSTVASSPRSLAASRTIQAVSEGLSGLGSSETTPKRWRVAVPNGIAFIADIPQPGSARSSLVHLQGGRAAQVGIRGSGGLARLIELQNAAGGLDIEPAVVFFEVFQVLCGNAVILGAQEQQ